VYKNNNTNDDDDVRGITPQHDSYRASAFDKSYWFTAWYVLNAPLGQKNLLRKTLDTNLSPSFAINLTCHLCMFLAEQNTFLGTIPLELGRLTNLLRLGLGA
jgi:hypothetical protein